MKATSHASTAERATRILDTKRATKVCMVALIPMRRDIRLQRAVPALVECGLDVTVIDIEQGRILPREESISSARIKHIRLSTRLERYYHGIAHLGPWLLFKVLRMFLCTLAAMRTPADIYHACDLTALPPCYIAARLRHKPLVFETYELPLATPTVTRSPLLHALSERMLHGMLSRCASVIVTSPIHAQEMAERFGGTPPTLVRNIPEYQAPVAAERLRQYLRLDPETRIALYQGYLQPGRGLEILIQAAKMLAPHTVIVLKGPGGESRDDLLALIAREGVANRVMIVPPAPRAEMHEWAASADIGLAIYPPSYSRNVQTLLPNKVFEYLMAGLPVVTSNVEAVADLIRAYDVGVVLPSVEPAVVAHAINALLEDAPELARMRRNALAATSRELRWDIECQQLARAYASLLPTAVTH